MPSTGWWAERAQYTGPGRVSEGFSRWYGRLVAPVLRWMHRPQLVGAEHLPRDRPFLLVANHSAAVGLSEIGCLIGLYLEQLRPLRLAAMAHPLSFFVWPITALMKNVGAIPSAYEPALQALRSGAGVLVFPGGDYETSRPFWQAHRVDFNRRKGFLRLARDAGVPIVPMGIRGSHLSAPVLWRAGRWLPTVLVLPRLFGLKRYPLTLSSVVGGALLAALLPAHLGWGWSALLVYLWMGSPLTLLPYVPTTIRFRVGQPVLQKELPDDLDAAYDAVVSKIQELVDAPDAR